MQKLAEHILRWEELTDSGKKGMLELEEQVIPNSPPVSKEEGESSQAHGFYQGLKSYLPGMSELCHKARCEIRNIKTPTL